MATQSLANSLNSGHRVPIRASYHLKSALLISFVFHFALVIYHIGPRTLLQAMPQAHQLGRTLHVSLGTQQRQQQMKAPPKPRVFPKKVSKRKVAPPTKRTQPLAQQQQQGRASAAPNTFDFYIQDYVEPIYPRIAQRRGITGKVVLILKVDKHGTVKQVEVSQSSGHAMLDESAVNAAKKWKFKPLASHMTQIALNKKIVFTM